ncbi:hypothetical protein GCM10011376_28500 [Nocardioides flavus (ex Wang et al. 2016)]|uniref:Uncharacterized protein n=1 Tax=Nocardioides flavus (ex Wang et al. 2016) TaxID=2058780 RepID=A0ABQ3HQU9_9ACTN|nr:hypothetical protein [Nocardioides flavus (ex Wang et al. 2016)]GHE18240.1 hypothetical protein GCM10011376_28500 [Nocardioides flavus (ex Wang et al. 2016)]
MTGRPHHRPMTPGGGFFAEIAGGADPAQVREAGDLAATVLVRGARASEDPEVAERIVHLAESEGLETLAEVWSGAPADTLAGCLWQLFLLRSWVYAAPEAVAAEYEAGQRRVDVARVVAGVADPPGPDELRRMVDDVLRGITRGDFAVTLFRAAAFARIVAAGRAAIGSATHEEISRVLLLSEQLEAAGHGEIANTLA